MRRYSRGLVAGAAAASLLALNAARAATAHTKLTISGCAAANVSSDSLFEMARAELAPRMLTVGDETIDAAAIHLHVTLCQGATNRVMLQLFDHGELRTLRHVDLSDVAGDLRTRTLAVALAELIAATPERDAADRVNGAGASATPQTAGPGVTAPTSKPIMEATAPESRAPVAPALTPTTSGVGLRGQAKPVGTMHVSTGGALRQFLMPQTTLIGPWLGVAWKRVGGEAQLLVNHQQTALGAIALYDVNLAATYRMISLGSLLVTSAHLRTEVGQILAQGKANRSVRAADNSERVTHLALAIDVEFEAAVQRHWGLELHLQAGAARGIAARVDGETIANTQGAFLGVSLGLNYAQFI